MKTLSQFVAEEERTLVKFKKWWIRMNKKEPENYPLEIEDDNQGIWFEMYMGFDEGEHDDES